ncbi:ribosome recycling factor [Candidatus Parcubacteria bacterium]|nr:ribosome recycling factor [Candidatus Parcubacteria bacterium]
MALIIEEYKTELEKAISHLKGELIKIRTGRANTALVDDIIIEAYEVKTPLAQLANITVPEVRTIIIQPWDKSVIKEIEKAIANSGLGAGVKNEGSILRIVLPQLTEEDRKKTVKILSEKLEQAKIALRQVRDEIKDKIKNMEGQKEISEDEKFRLIEELDLIIKERNKEIEDIGKAKEEELMTV